MTGDESLAVVSKFLADHDRPKLMWDVDADDPPLVGTPILYVPFEDESEESDEPIGGVNILVEVQNEDEPEGLDYVLVHIGRESATLRVERIQERDGLSVRVTLTEPI